MPEKKQGKRAVAEETERTGFVSRFAKHLFDTVEHFIDRVSDIAEDRVLAVINQIAVRLLLCLFLVIGIIFFLAGGVRVIDHIVQFPGIGQVMLGSLTLLVTGIVWLTSREREAR